MLSCCCCCFQVSQTDFYKKPAAAVIVVGLSSLYYWKFSLYSNLVKEFNQISSISNGVLGLEEPVAIPTAAAFSS